MNREAKVLNYDGGKRFGFDAFQLKLFALAAMTLDHIFKFLSPPLAIPMWFHLAGRFAAPLFLFFCAEGFAHTRDRPRYMRRLYAAHVLMSAGNTLLSECLPLPSGLYIENAMFGTLFLTVLTLWSIDRLRNGRGKARLLGLAGLLLPLLGLFLVLAAEFAYDRTGQRDFLYAVWLVRALFPSWLTVEVGWLYPLMGVGFYCLRNLRWGSLAVMAAAAAITVLAIGTSQLTPEKWASLACFCLAAVPMLLYNGEPGKHRMKWLFYLYYPGHIYCLYLFSWILQNG